MRFRNTQVYCALMVTVVSYASDVDAQSACERTGPVEVSNGFLSAQELVAMTDASLTYYVMGFVNGFAMSPVVKAPERCVSELMECLDGKTNQQLAAMLRKHLTEHPEEWHWR